MLNVIGLLKLFTKALPTPEMSPGRSKRKHSITFNEDDENVYLNLWIEGDYPPLNQSIILDDADMSKDSNILFDEIMVFLQSDEITPEIKSRVCELLETA